MPEVTRLALPRIASHDVPDLGRPDASFASRVVAHVRAVRDERPIKHVHLVGGGASGELATAIARDLTIPCTRSSDPLAPARAGARLRASACLDIGRATLKSVDGIRVTRLDRDLARAPLRDGADLETARASTIELLAELLAAMSAKILVGLPCRLVDGVPTGPSSYAWRDPDPELVPELAKRADRTLEIVEAVELAALAAAENRLVPKAGTTLVLSIGAAVSGALLLPE